MRRLLCSLFFFFFFFFLFLFHSHTVYAARISEYRALLSFKESSITDDPTNALSSWNSSTTYCSWFGVTCDSRRHVTTLNLTSSSLSGTLHDDLSHLPFLS